LFDKHASLLRAQLELSFSSFPIEILHHRAWIPLDFFFRQQSTNGGTLVKEKR
jgi:hypothetical protein